MQTSLRVQLVSLNDNSFNSIVVLESVQMPWRPTLANLIECNKREWMQTPTNARKCNHKNLTASSNLISASVKNASIISQQTLVHLTASSLRKMEQTHNVSVRAIWDAVK